MSSPTSPPPEPARRPGGTSRRGLSLFCAGPAVLPPRRQCRLGWRRRWRRARHWVSGGGEGVPCRCAAHGPWGGRARAHHVHHRPGGFGGGGVVVAPAGGASAAAVRGCSGPQSLPQATSKEQFWQTDITYCACRCARRCRLSTASAEQRCRTPPRWRRGRRWRPLRRGIPVQKRYSTQHRGRAHPPENYSTTAPTNLHWCNERSRSPHRHWDATSARARRP